MNITFTKLAGAFITVSGIAYGFVYTDAKTMITMTIIGASIFATKQVRSTLREIMAARKGL